MMQSFPIKALFTPRRHTIEPSQITSEQAFHYSLPVWHETGDGQLEDPSELASLKLLLEGGEVLVSKLNPEKGAVVHAVAKDVPVISSTEFIALRPKIADGRFGYWLMQSAPVRMQLEASIESVTNSHKRARVDKFLASRVQVPDLPTQKRIATFLDRETARIDELIALRTRFEAKVKESREALIASLLVGLPEENQRPSTTNWLENLPSQVARERAKVHFQERVQLSETGDEELLTVSHLTGVTRRSEKNVNMIMAESHEGYKLVQPNDLVINTMWAWMGAMGVSKEAGLISPAYGIYRPTSGKLLPEYVDLLVRSKPFVAEATRRSKGIHSSRLRLYPDAFLDMRLPVPTLEQQDSILKQIEARATREDTLVEKNAKATELLREYRTALITAAVTGQIDVDTYGKASTTSAALDRIEEEMQA